MFSSSELISQNLSTAYNQLSLFDQITIKIMVNYRKLIFLSVLSIFLTTSSTPILASVGWVTYFTTSFGLIYLQYRFNKYTALILIAAVTLMKAYSFFLLML